MKKRLLVKIASLFLIFGLVTGCGNDDYEPETNNQNGYEEGNGERELTVQEFFANNPDELQDLIAMGQEETETISETMGVEMTFDVEVVGPNSIAFIYIYGPSVEIHDEMGPALTTTLESLAAIHEMTAAGIRETIGVSTLYLIIRYVDNDGNVLAEGTFAGQ